MAQLSGKENAKPFLMFDSGLAVTHKGEKNKYGLIKGKSYFLFRGGKNCEPTKFDEEWMF